MKDSYEHPKSATNRKLKNSNTASVPLLLKQELENILVLTDIFFPFVLSELSPSSCINPVFYKKNQPFNPICVWYIWIPPPWATFPFPTCPFTTLDSLRRSRNFVGILTAEYSFASICTTVFFFNHILGIFSSVFGSCTDQSVRFCFLGSMKDVLRCFSFCWKALTLQLQIWGGQKFINSEISSPLSLRAKASML